MASFGVERKLCMCTREQESLGNLRELWGNVRLMRFVSHVEACTDPMAKRESQKLVIKTAPPSAERDHPLPPAARDRLLASGERYAGPIQILDWRAPLLRQMRHGITLLAGASSYGQLIARPAGYCRATRRSSKICQLSGKGRGHRYRTTALGRKL